MTKFFINWEIESTVLPDNLKERMALLLKLADMFGQDGRAGLINDWGRFSGMQSGYIITSDISEGAMYLLLLKYEPYLKFETKPVLTGEQTRKAIEEALEMLEK